MPSNNDPMLEQLIGRIMRQHPGKSSAEVYDIVLGGNTGENQLRTRMAFYNREKYEISEITL
jgi:superfamily II DNA or RNA helicase